MGKYIQPVREAVSYRELFTAGWFGVKEKHCFRLKIYDRLRASEHADCSTEPLDLGLHYLSMTIYLIKKNKIHEKE